MQRFISSNWLKKLGMLVVTVISWPVISAHAQSYPSKPITIVSPFAAGGTSDVVARSLARVLEQDLGQAVIVVNRAGAGGTLGIGSVAAASADGYTLVMGGLGSIVFPSVVYHGKIKYDASKDLVPLGAVGYAPTVIAMNSSFAAAGLKDIIAAAKASPNKIAFASAGIGGTLHVAGVLLEREAGIALNHIPYKGGAPAMTDLIGGSVDLALADLTLLKPFINGGRIRALAIASAERSSMLPDVPTTAELGLPKVRLDTWYALFAPKGTPSAVITNLRSALEKVKANPNFAATLSSQGLVAMKGNAEAFEEQLKRDFETWPPLLTRICAQNACN